MITSNLTLLSGTRIGNVPLSAVTPFTHRDNVTYAEILFGLINWFNKTHIPEIDDIIKQVNNELKKYADDINTTKDQWEKLYNDFMANVVERLEGLNDQAVANLVTDEVSKFFKALARFEFDNSRVINACGAEARSRGIALIADGSHANGIGAGTDNTASLNALMEIARTSRRRLFIPAGKYFVPGEIDNSGVDVEGDSSGYYNENGTVIIGNRSGITFNQKQVKKAHIRMRVANIRFENVNTAVKNTYSVYSEYDNVTIIEAWSDAFICGDNDVIGGLWNEFNRCQFSSLNGTALRLQGKDWANNTVFNTCDFNTRNESSAAVIIKPSGGFGAINTIFNDCEIRGLGRGVWLDGMNHSTKLNSCYMECHGPAVWISGSSPDLNLNGGVWGSLKNDHVSGKASFIHHASGGTDVRVNGGWVTVSSTSSDRNNLSFITSDLPGSCLLLFTHRPRISVSASGFKLIGSSGLEERKREFLGDLEVRKSSRPGISFAYSDGSKPVVIERNGSQDGEDFGVNFRSDDKIFMRVSSTGRVDIGHQLGLPEFVNGRRAGETGLYAKVYTNIGAPRYIQVYTGTDVTEV